MANKDGLSWRLRPLLTETLPYEVPVIFSNDRFFKAVCFEPRDPHVKKALEKLFSPLSRYTKPYSYQIRKDTKRTTTLSIVHPLWQVELCSMYSDHEGSLLAYCAKSEFSLRRPYAVAQTHIERLDSTKKTLKEGLVEIESGAEHIDPVALVSYFTYAKFSLLSKFFGSREFLRHEERFVLMRTLDISKCFYNIYSHTVSWAVKDKEFAKENANAHSFEAKFDRLMQRANYNETHGIVVGPEISRIFSEIILQEVDVRVQRDLLKVGLRHEVDFVARRYVDDYFVFAKSEEVLDEIERSLATHLESFKLYLNTQKIQTYERPFITPLTIARHETSELLGSVRALLSDSSRPAKLRARDIRRAIHQLRGIVSRSRVEVASLSGSLVASLRRMIAEANRQIHAAPPGLNSDDWLDVVRAILDLVFYVCALDLRVRTTYGLCQVIRTVLGAERFVPDPHFDQVRHVVGERLVEFTVSFMRGEEAPREDAVELFNLLICGTYFLGQSFTENTKVRNLLTELLNGKISYFRYVTLKFCFLADRGAFVNELASLNAIVMKKLQNEGNVQQDSELFLLLCDFLGAPDVEDKEKRLIYNRSFGGVISSATMAALGSVLGFVDWEGVAIEHTLQRKELRPVYAVA